MAEVPDAKIIAEEKDLWPDKTFVLTLVVVSPDFLAKHADLVEKILKVHCDWTLRLSTDAAAQVPDLTRALDALTGKKLSEKIVGDAVSRVRFTNEPNADSIKVFAQWAYDLGFAKGVPDVKTLVDTSLLRRLRPSTPAGSSTPANGKH